MKKNLVSIAMATYNGDKYLEKQLESICNQTYKNIELVICDDCSTDKTEQIINSYKNKIDIRYYRNNRRLGVVKNFEKAIYKCSGEYIALCDQDDIWYSNKIKTLVENIGNNLLIHSDGHIIDKTSNIYSKSLTDYSRKSIYSQDFLTLLFNNTVTGCTCLFRKQLIQYALPFPKDAFIHDWWLALHAANKNSLKYIHTPLIGYRSHMLNLIGPKKHNTIRGFNRKEIDSFNRLALMKCLGKNPNLSNKNKKKVDYFIKYYEAFFELSITYENFCFRLKKFNKFSHNHNMVYRILDCLLSMFGKNIQRIIYQVLNLE